jgi:hypothetical protein
MTKLSLIFNTCEYKKPDEGVAGAIESYFEEEKKYNETFPESKIKKPLGSSVDHIVFKYIDCWNLKFFLDRTFKSELNTKQKDFYIYISWYILVDVYIQLQDWKEKVFTGTWHEWIEYTESQYFKNALIKYLRPRYNAYLKMLPKDEVEPRNFYKSLDGRKKFTKDSGSFNLFKQEINKTFNLFKKSIN